MVLRGVFCAYLVCVCPALAASSDPRADDMAECGYLAHMAVQQMKKRTERPAVYDQLVTEVIDFTNLYYHLSDRTRTAPDGRIDGEMLWVTASAGKAVHDARTRAMSPRNALKLSNRVLDTCRTDLRLLGLKLGQR